MIRTRLVLNSFAFVIGISAATVPSASAEGFLQHNLVADLPGVADHTDEDLKNPWGLVRREDRAFQIALNHTSKSKAYKFDGEGDDTSFDIPAPGGDGGAPTGIVRNEGDGFKISKDDKRKPSEFILSTEDGTIVGWNRSVDAHTAIIKVDNSSSGAIYKGLAIGRAHHEDFIYATNFGTGATVEMYDERFKLVKTFTDPDVDAGFAPFGIENIHGKLYVTYAKQAGNGDDEPGPGNGFVDIFSLEGKLLKRLISHGPLNSPWGVALAPCDFGKASGRLIVGNFGDGAINLFDPKTGAFVGPLEDPHGAPIVIPGLWGLKFAQSRDDRHERESLFFTAGPGDEENGLFGNLTPERSSQGDFESAEGGCEEEEAP